MVLRLKMQGSKLNEYFQSFPFLKKHYDGIFAINTLPKSIKVRHFCICNTDESTGNGIHWFCFVRTTKSTIECFDSLGVCLEKKEKLQKYCNFRAIREIEFNETSFQAKDTDTCGLFTVYFIIQRMHNFDLTFDDLLEQIFDPENHEENEKIVSQFCNNLT